jgi:hypothetical protein
MIAKDLIPGSGTKSFAIMNVDPELVRNGVSGTGGICWTERFMIAGRNGRIDAKTARDHERLARSRWWGRGFGLVGVNLGGG